VIAFCRDHGSDVQLRRGAGDGNRTRTISLGINTIHAATRPDLRRRLPASDRERPLLTGVNGPLMARRSRRRRHAGYRAADNSQRWLHYLGPYAPSNELR
jgi:hypothetical protein